MVKLLNLTDFKEKVFDYEINKDWNFKGDKPIIIDFYADWCGPCKALAPILEELSLEYQNKLDIYKVNTQREMELAGMFGIRSIPSVLFIPMKGQPMMIPGLLPKEQIKKVITDILEV
jgi:thioredoxin 1